MRERAGLTLRALAARAGTSHSTVAAYESGRKVPSVDTFVRLARAAGFELDVALRPALGGPDPSARGDELREALELAAMFPARHSTTLEFPPFANARRP